MLNFNIDTFFEKIQPFFGATPLTGGQKLNMQTLLGLGVMAVPSLEAMAYVLATVRHEAGAAMAPIAEIGEGRGRDYGKMLDMGDGPGKRVPYTTPNQLYYGRGHVQLTWRCNYVAMGNLVGADLLNHPDLMLTVAVSAHVAILGMTRGSFTGHKLADYFAPGHTPEPVNARHIINGTDKAELIAGYYVRFLAAIQAAHQPVAPQVSVVVVAPAAAETLAAAPGPATEAATAGPGLVVQVNVGALLPAADELLAAPTLVAEVSDSDAATTA